MSKFVSDENLAYFAALLAELYPTKTAVNNAINTAINNLPTTSATNKGTSSTAAATQTKIVESSGFVLEFGATIDVKFTYALSVAAPSLNVNSTGIKPIKYMKSNGSLTDPSATTSVSQGGWAAGQTVRFMYNGTYWIEILNISTGAYYGQSYYAQSATSANKANNTSVEHNYTKTNPCYPIFSNSNAQGASTPSCIDNNFSYLPSTGVLSLGARPQVNGEDVALNRDIPTDYVKFEESVTVEPQINELLEKIYPIGSIYMSVNNVSPASFLGGTWERIQDRFLLGAGSTYSAGSTGGEATHTLTINEMPVHGHRQRANHDSDQITSADRGYGRGGGWGLKTDTYGTNYYQGTANTGGGQAHNNMPPYLAVYIFKRIA